MKRPPQLWVVGIGIVCIWLLPNALAVRATSLIHAKTSTTTSTTSATDVSSPSDEEASSVSTSDSPADNQTVTKPPLTGIPQIDYIWDPNLPFELKGYNLSEYPFYDRVPEEIDFKCDGLHDGFYASVPHKCQVYHHCLYGTRYDFLCANFTAFDQRTFICHFVSEVDCINSKNFWHRNDALYQAASTTTVSTTTAQVIATPSPALNPNLRRPSPLAGGLGRRRRPFRRRPAYEYYYDDVEDYDDRDRPRMRDKDRDDYYDEPPLRSSGSRRRKRPRPNRRPIEYDEYEEYEDDRYERRPGRRDEDRDRDRRPYRDDDRRYDDRRPLGKNKDRHVDEEEEEKRPADRKKSDDRRRPIDDLERRPYDRRKPSRDRYEDDKDEDLNDRRSFDRPRKQDDDDRRYRPKDPKPEDRRKPIEEERRYRPRDKLDDRRPTEETKLLIKPSSGSSVFDRPRAPPIIRRPVPKNEQEKYNYKSVAAAVKPSSKPEIEDEEYYDDYEEEPKPKPTRKTIEPRESEEKRSSTRRTPYFRRPLDKEEERRPSRIAQGSRAQERERSSKKPPVEEEYADEYEEDTSREKIKPVTTEESVSREKRPEPVIKIVKRPFLPSRGGNPFQARGLQPVGAKALDATPETIIKSPEKPKETSSTVNPSEEEYYDDEEEIKPVTKRPAFRTLESRTTQKPKLPDNYRNPLDIIENEYDVTLNDALNPTLPNLPVRSSPTGFSSGRGYLGPRLISVESPALTASSSDYVYVKQPTTRYNPYVALQLNRQPYSSYH